MAKPHPRAALSSRVSRPSAAPSATPAQIAAGARGISVSRHWFWHFRRRRRHHQTERSARRTRDPRQQRHQLFRRDRQQGDNQRRHAGRDFCRRVSSFSGGVTNSAGGVISAVHSGIGVFANSIFAGGIVNKGTIVAHIGIGINLTQVTSFTGGISNSGAINAGLNGIFVPGGSDFSGGVTNSGTISGFSQSGIRIQENVSFSGGIFNNAGGVIRANFSAIDIFNDSAFSGGVTNKGTIVAGPERGVDVFGVSEFSGGVTNSGTISARERVRVEAILVGLAGHSRAVSSTALAESSARSFPPSPFPRSSALPAASSTRA